MLISKAQLQSIIFASTKAQRQSITSLLVTDREVVATDGHRMNVVEHGTLPNLGIFIGEYNTEPLALPIMVTGDSIRAILKAWPKVSKRETQPYHLWGRLTSSTFTVIDANRDKITFPIKLEDGVFPSWEQVMPAESERPFRMGLNVSYLADTKYLATGRQHLIDIRLLDRTNSALIVGENAQGQSTRHVIMPMMLDKSDHDKAMDQLSSEYYSTLHSLDAAPYEVLETLVKPLEPEDVIELSGKRYLKRDLDAFIASRQPVTA